MQADDCKTYFSGYPLCSHLRPSWIERFRWWAVISSNRWRYRWFYIPIGIQPFGSWLRYADLSPNRTREPRLGCTKDIQACRPSWPGGNQTVYDCIETMISLDTRWGLGLAQGPSGCSSFRPREPVLSISRFQVFPIEVEHNSFISYLHRYCTMLVNRRYSTTVSRKFIEEVVRQSSLVICAHLWFGFGNQAIAFQSW